MIGKEEEKDLRSSTWFSRLFWAEFEEFLYKKSLFHEEFRAIDETPRGSAESWCKSVGQSFFFTGKKPVVETDFIFTLELSGAKSNGFVVYNLTFSRVNVNDKF